MNKKFLIPVIIGIVVLIALIGIGIRRVAVPAGKVKSAVSVSASGLSAQAKEAEVKGDLLGAKTAYQQLLSDFSNAGEVLSWQKKLDDIDIKLLFSSTVTPGSVLYEIKPGDTLNKIAKEFKTTTGLIMKSNNLSGDRIVPGRKIKVWNVPFTILVDKSQNTLTLKANEEIIKTYTVSTGKNNCTPLGNFKITNKLVNPTWFKSGAVVPASSPENILGSRWLGFDLAGYGIHGTTEPDKLGQQVTQGCVRMANSEVEELYIIIPVGTEVTIVD